MGRVLFALRFGANNVGMYICLILRIISYHFEWFLGEILCFFFLREKSRKGGNVTIHIATWSLLIWWNFGWQLLLESLQALAKLKADPVFNVFFCLFARERKLLCLFLCF